MFKFSNEHLENCRNEKVACKFCGAFRRRVQMEEHLTKECRKVSVACDFAYVGCTHSDLRNRMELHYDNKRFRKQHVEMLQLWISNAIEPV